jgi:purine-nucleoside phosphorylase
MSLESGVRRLEERTDLVPARKSLAVQQEMQRIAIATGSGINLESLLDSVETVVPFKDIPGLSEAELPGHRHVFIHGKCGGIPVILQCGRLHFYQGLDYAAVTRTIDVLREWGVSRVIFVNAAGGLDPSMSCGDLLAVERVRLWRYTGWDATPGVAFTDFLVPGCDWTGTFQWVHGPSYETRTEIAALQHLKSSAVGMSTAPELLRCQELGIRGAVISCIANCCYRPQILTHQEVVSVAGRTSSRIGMLLRQFLPLLAAEP